MCATVARDVFGMKLADMFKILWFGLGWAMRRRGVEGGKAGDLGSLARGILATVEGKRDVDARRSMHKDGTYS
jgi:hypothetical protein